MNLRSTYILFAAVVVVLIVFVVVLTFGPRSDAEDYLFPELHNKGKNENRPELTKIELVSAATELVMGEERTT